jgi:hypothetical protein
MFPRSVRFFVKDRALDERRWRMSRKSGRRFSEKDMRQQKNLEPISIPSNQDEL